MLELELKAVVSEPDALRARLLEAGASPGFHGVMRDRRLDRDGALGSRDEVLRLRRYEPVEGAATEEVGWKGPTRVSDGYKARRELGARLSPGDSLEEILAALGFTEVHAIDRHVELYQIAGGDARIEWYPDLDTLVEVEGAPAAIERITSLSGIAREQFRADPLDWFVADYERRTGRTARLRLARGEEPAHWPR